jgi:DNA-binding helix-hairpin-helix protein with protein kinase domain
MNQAFWALVEKNMTKGEIREIFFKDKGASTKKELQYIPGDPAFLNWQQMLLQLDQLKKQEKQMEQQAQAQAQAQEAQAQEMERQKAIQDAQHAREQEKHDAEMAQTKGRAAYNAKKHGSKTKETAKNTGNSGASNIGGTNVKNPLNLDL